MNTILHDRLESHSFFQGVRNPLFHVWCPNALGNVQKLGQISLMALLVLYGLQH